MRITVLLASALCLMALSACGNKAQQAQQPKYPSKSVTTLVVPQTAGGATDIVARIIATHLSTSLHHNVVVENRDGARGNIGGQYVAKSTPDGHTLLLAPATILIQFTRPQGYDPMVDLTPVALVAEAPEFIAISAKLDAKTTSEFIEYARSRPGELNYGSPGVGTVPHLSMERFSRATGIQMQHVPYGGTAPAMVDVASGTIQAAIGTLGSIQPFTEGGTVRVLAIAAKERFAGAPDVPTLKELGYNDLEMSTWWGIVAPKGTPPETIKIINAALQEAFSDPKTVETLSKLGLVARSESTETFADFIQSELAVWGDIAAHAGLKKE